VVDFLDKTIGRYVVKEMIGEGAMAKVYRAYDPEINRSVVFKVLKDEFCVDEEYLHRFLREAKAAGALSHANIVTVFDVGKLEDSPYIMMELLEGRDLGEHLSEKKTLSIKDTLTIATQLAKALDYAHSTGVVHRDIKPDNIVVMPDGETIKVADFGIARMDENEEAQKTQVGSVLGTPRYMSPEQALGEDVDGRSDLFSVGVILYEMLTGTKAFDAKNIGTLMIQIAQKQPIALNKLRKDIPSGLKGIIQKLLQKKPGKRFQTGGELAKALIRELVALKEQDEEKNKHKYVPLKVRWALSMGAIVAVVLMISMSVVFSYQSKTMTQQAVATGELFTKFIANDLAEKVLYEDWIVLDTIINGEHSLETFKYLTVADHNGVVQVATDKSLVGKKYEARESAELINETEDVRTTDVTLEDNSHVFNISAPIKFQNKKVGRVILGLSQDGLNNVKSVTRWLMFLLALVTISAVVLMIFIFGAMLAKPFKMIGRSLKNFSDGNYDTRISTIRNDEIGELFKAFDDMAVHIQGVIVGVDEIDDSINEDIEPSADIEEEKSKTKKVINKKVASKKTDAKKPETKKAKTKKAATTKKEKIPKVAIKDISDVEINDDETIMASSMLSVSTEQINEDATIIAPIVKKTIKPSKKSSKEADK
jgi:serine/threonine protein kinase/HAMP domain-containing protein